MRGTFGCVDMNDDCTAVKSLLSDKAFPYFVREAATYRYLNNKIPNVVPVQWINRDKLCLKRYHCDLATQHERTPFTPSQIYNICHKLLVVIQNLKVLGVSHRDIKLANILYAVDDDVNDTSDVSIALCDFGLSRFYVDTVPEHVTGVVQSEFYRAPEIMFADDTENTDLSRGKKSKLYDIHAIDIWSLGICLMELCRLHELTPLDTLRESYQMLYGGNTFPDLVANTTLYESYDPRFLRILKKMLTLDWTKRATTETLLADPFFSTTGSAMSDAMVSSSSETHNFMYERSMLFGCEKKLSESRKETYDMLSEFNSNYVFDTDESQSLANILGYRLLLVTDLTEEDMYEVAALAAMIYDTSTPYYNKDRCLELLEKLNYDLLWPVQWSSILL